MHAWLNRVYRVAMSTVYIYPMVVFVIGFNKPWPIILGGNFTPSGGASIDQFHQIIIIIME